jgi:hypothetical protein
VVLGGETRAEQSQGREVDSARLEQLQDNGEAPCRPRHRDAVVRLLLRKGQDLPTVPEEGAVAGAQMHVTRIELGEVCDEENRGAALTSGEVLDPCDELGVGKAPQGSEKVDLHFLLVSRVGVPSGPGGSAMTIGRTLARSFTSWNDNGKHRAGRERSLQPAHALGGRSIPWERAEGSGGASAATQADEQRAASAAEFISAAGYRNA